MNVKILLFPLILVTIIWLLIWFIVPDFQAIMAQSKKLEATKKKLEEIQSRTGNIAKLYGEISQNAEKRDILFRFIPEERRDEDIINTLNTVAGVPGESVSLLKISSIKIKEKAAAPVAPLTMGESMKMPDFENSPVPAFINEPLPTPVDANIDFSIASDYLKIKNFLRRIYALKRFNSFDTVRISKITSQSNEQKLPDDFLQAEIATSFNFMEKYKQDPSIENKIFSSGQFSLDAIALINKRIATDINQPIVGATGKPNPFIP